MGWGLGFDFTTYWIWYVLILMVFIVYISIGAFYLRSNIFISAFTEGKSTSGKLSLTFDDGPNENSLEVLDVLKKSGQKATFFCIGSRIEERPDIFNRMIAEGHEVGNHGYSHNRFSPFYSRKKIELELVQTNALIKKHTGKKNKIYRPPFGVTNPRIADVVKKLKLKVIGWSVRSLDTIKSKEQAVEKIKAGLKPGAVILLHDDRTTCVPILLEVLKLMERKSLHSVTVTDLLDLRDS